MNLSTHAIGGATAALVVTHNPALAFGAGFISHFVLDAIPHWHYHLKSQRRPTDDPMDVYYVFDRSFLIDLFTTGADAALGLFAIAAVLWSAPAPVQLAAFFGAVGGVLPDLLQLAYSLLRHTPLKYLQHFHLFIHARRFLDDNLILGLGSQFVLIAFFLIVIARSS